MLKSKGKGIKCGYKKHNKIIYKINMLMYVCFNEIEETLKYVTIMVNSFKFC